MNGRQSFLVVVLLAAMLPVIGTGCSKQAKAARHAERADKYFKKDQLEQAKIEYFNLLQLDRTNSVAIRRLGLILFDQGAPLQAFSFLLKARDLYPSDTELRLRLAYVLLAGREQAQARQEAITILASSPTNDEAILLLGDASLLPEEMADARQRLQALQQRTGDRAAYHMVAASWHLRGQDSTQAETEVRRALALDPRFRWAHLSLAGMLWAQTNLAQAEQEFRTAAELSPLRSVGAVRHAEFKAKTGSLEGARKILQDQIAKVPDYLPPRATLAQIALAEQKYDEAADLAQKILRTDPASVDMRLLLSQVWLGKGQTARAVQEIEILDRIFPKAPQTKLQLAMAQLRDGKLASARASIAQAIALDPNFAEAVLFDAELDLRQNDPSKAANSLIGLLKKRPELVQAHLLLADAYLALDRPDDALTVHRALVQTYPKNPQLQFVLGVVLRRQQKLTEARAAFDRAWELSPENPMPLFQLVELDLSEEKFTQAMARVQSHVQKNPKAANAHFLEGRVHAAQTNWNGAEAALQKTLDLDPNFISAYYVLATMYSQSNRQTNAVSQLESLIAKRPNEQRALMLLGMLQDERKEFAKARDTYERVLKLNPSFLPALNNLAYLYAERTGQMERAHELARKARGLRPEDPTVADTLGWILYRRKDYADALALLRESAEKLPGNPEVQFHVGMAYYMNGQVGPAVAALRQATTAKGEFPWKEEARQRLAQLSSSGTDAAADSLASLEKAARERPSDIIVRARLGELYQQQGKNDQAVKAFQDVLAINPKAITPLTRLAQLYAGPLQDKTKAMEYARRAHELAPADGEVSAVLGHIAFESGEHVWAHSLLQESARRLPKRGDVAQDLAWALYSLGRESDAVAAMQSAVTLDARIGAAQPTKDFLGMVALRRPPQNMPEAERQASQVLARQPKHVPAMMVLAAMQERRGDTNGAARTCEQVLEKFPEFVPAQKQLSMLLASQAGSVERAYQLALKVRQSLPDDLELARTLGILSCQRKDFASAVRWLQQVSGKQPTDAQAQYYLGLAYAATKETARSKRCLEIALEQGLPESQATNAHRILAEIKSP